MKITHVTVSKLLAFQELSLTFSPGINVIIGENSTGKTHLMKLMYGAIRAHRQYQGADETSESSSEGTPAAVHHTKVAKIISARQRRNRSASESGRGRQKGSAELNWNSDGRFRFTITSQGRVTRRYAGEPLDAVFLPSREVLAMYPGFIVAYENRELSFDETYYDICKALSGTTLRGPRGKQANELIKPLLHVLGGRVVFDGSRFVLHSKKRGNIEAPLLSEGFRKLGVLAHLIANGTLTKRSVLFWDEPEASLNPKVVTVLAKMLRTLAQQGVQVFLATHDFLLTQELSMAAEYKTQPQVAMKFVALSRSVANSKISAQYGDTLVDLKDNAILAEFAVHYDREQTLVQESSSNGKKSEATTGSSDDGR